MVLNVLGALISLFPKGTNVRASTPPLGRRRIHISWSVSRSWTKRLRFNTVRTSLARGGTLIYSERLEPRWRLVIQEGHVAPLALKVRGQLWRLLLEVFKPSLRGRYQAMQRI